MDRCLQSCEKVQYHHHHARMRQSNHFLRGWEEKLSTDENKAVVTRHLKEVLEQGRVELIASSYAPDESASDMDIPEQWKERVLWHHNHCPGFKVTILDMLAEGDKVAVYWQYDLTYSIPDEAMSDPPYPVGKPVTWRNNAIYRIVNGHIVSWKAVLGYVGMLVENGINPSSLAAKNKAAVVKFIDAFNRQDTALLAEVCDQPTAQQWIDALPNIYAVSKDHHMEVTEIITDDDGVAVKLASSGYHTGELFGLPATGKWWTNRIFAFFRFKDGKICDIDAFSDVENHIQQIGGVIRPIAE